MAFTRPRRPRPFVRLTRAQLEQQIEHYREARDRAIARERAHRDWVASWLEQRADAHTLDAGHAKTPEPRQIAHRMTAADLRQLALDVERMRPDAH